MVDEMAADREELIRRWSDALRDVEVLEPWLTESEWDAGYWDDVAAAVVEHAGEDPTPAVARASLEGALASAFPSAALRSNNGLYRDRLDQRLDLIVSKALAGA
jgi:hypothetical protein